MNTSFKRLVRFENDAGKVLYGDLPERISASESLVGKTVDVLEGKTPWDSEMQRTSEKDVIKTSPIPISPVVFNKPPTALAGPEEDIPIHKEARLLDYEGELTVIIGKHCKNLSAEDNPLDYVLGYTVGNDISSRYWQAPEISGRQAGYAKSFDKFAPIGPVLCSTVEIPDPSKLTLTTFVNGEERQRSGTNDLIFDVNAIIRFLSVGHTLVPGTVIMTGTPSGVAVGMTTPTWLKDGDVVEVNIDGIGRIRNKMVFEI